MLVSLTIKNTAIIDKLTVDFENGMNCMTGETGAGKSIIIDSLCCLLGERVSRESIRKGAKEAEVTGVFQISNEKVSDVLRELGIDPEDDGTLILYRSYSETKNTCRINGNVVTLSALKKLGELLVDVHGQHDNHALLSQSTHIGLLDLYAGNELSGLMIDYKLALGELRAVREELDEITGDPKKRAQLASLLEYQVEEIFNAKLKPGEDEILEKKQEILDNSEKIATKLGEAKISISGGYEYSREVKGATDLVDDAISSISSIEKYGDEFANLVSQLKDAKYALLDAEATLEDLSEAQSFDPNEAQKIADRIDAIYELKRKYGNTVDEILKYGNDAQDKLDKLKGCEERAEELNKKKTAIIKKLLDLAEKIHKVRENSAKKLAESVKENLVSMEMGKVTFKASVDILPCGEDGENFKQNGLDNVEFLISTNPGQSMGPLSKIASGGELSRIMLAIKSVLADVDEIPVLVFDEIDTGISGIAAGNVAKQFIKISDKHQLICVSHLAQIAAIADNNIVVTKLYGDDFVKTEVKNAVGEEKISEIARLLDGDKDSALARAHAKDLIDRMSNRR